MVTIGEIRTWSVEALEGVYEGINAHNTTSAQLDADLLDHGGMGYWEGGNADIARAAISRTRSDIADFMQTLAAVRTSVETTKEQVSALKQNLANTEFDAGDEGFAIEDDGSVDDLRPPSEEPVESESRQRRKAEFETIVGEYMAAASEIEQESAASLLNAIGAAALDADGQPIPKIEPALGAIDGLFGQDGTLTDEAWDRVTALGLDEQQLAAMANGDDVVVSDKQLGYLRQFFASAGRDGIVNLTEELSSAADSGDETAKTRLDALASGFLTLSNEDVRSADGSQHGGFDALPDSVRDLYGTLVYGPDANLDDVSHDDSMDLAFTGMHDQTVIAKLLSSDGAASYVPGTEFAVAAERQGASWLTSSPDEFGYATYGAGQTNASVNEAVQSILDVGSRNHDASTILLTGADPEGGNLNPPGYSRDHFANAILTHDWDDDGAAAAKLFSWTATDAHLPGSEGDSARAVLAELPQIFAPSEGRTYSDQNLPDNAASFAEFANSFHDNPSLANAMSRVVTGNLDAFTDPTISHTDTGATGNVVFNREDGDRLIFLGSQTDQGMERIIAANEAYRNDVWNRALADPANPDLVLLEASGIDSLDARVTSMTTNAQTYILSEDVAAQNEAAQHAYETRERIAGYIADAVRIPIDIGVEAGAARLGPASEIASNVAGVGLDAVTDYLLQAAVGEPDPDRRVEMPNASAMGELVERRVLNEVLGAQIANGKLDPQLIGNGLPIDMTAAATSPESMAEYRSHLNLALDDYLNRYLEGYKREVSDSTAATAESMQRLITGTN